MMTTHTQLSVIVPCYNEEQRIAHTVSKLLPALEKLKISYEVIVVNDGSVDNTHTIIKDLAHEDNNIKALSYHINRGKGYAVKCGIKKSQGEYYLIMDADLATDISELKKFWDKREQADCLIGNRNNEHNKRDVIRNIAGSMSRGLINTALNLNIKDTQCGFKLLSAKTKDMWSHVHSERRGFDFELLYLLQKYGHSIKQIDVKRNDIAGSKVNFSSYLTTWKELRQTTRLHNIKTLDRIGHLAVSALAMVGIVLYGVTSIVNAQSNSNGSASSYNSNGSATSNNSNTLAYCNSFDITNYNSNSFTDPYSPLCGTAAGEATAGFPTANRCTAGSTPFLQNIAIGNLDNTFSIDSNGDLKSVITQSNNKILIGGNFTFINGIAKNRIARLNSDGSLDTSFNATIDNTLQSIVEQSNGKIVVGGNFSSINGIAKNNIARLNSDGSLDTSFIATANDTIFSIVEQSNGKIIVGGNFSSINGIAKNNIARLNSDGSLDTSFNAISNGNINNIAIQSDGKIIIGNNGLQRFNTDGSLDTFFTSNSFGGIVSIALQPDGKIVVGTTVQTVRLNTDGSFDLRFSDGRNIASAIQSDGKIIVGGIRSQRFNTDGSLDNSLITINISSRIDSLAIQADRKILVAGSFTYNNGISKRYIIRLNPDAGIEHYTWACLTPQGNFNSNGSASSYNSYGSATSYNSYGSATSYNSNGSATSYNSYGSATSYNSEGSATSYNSDGSATSNSSNTISFCKSYDPLSFSVGFGQGSDCGTAAGAITTSFPTGGLCQAGTPFLQQILTVASLRDTTFDPGNGANGTITSVALQPDGKIIVGGGFTTFGGIARNNIARLNANGSLDTTFNPGDGADNLIRSVALQPDGKIIVGGFFTSFEGVARNRIARLNSDGSLDTTFDPGNGANRVINSVALQPDGKIIVGGGFSSFGGVTRNRIARLNSDGSLDTTFDPGNGTDKQITSVALQPDGKIIVGGKFSSFEGVARNNIARLNANGSLDTTFNPGDGTNNIITSVALQPDGKIIVGGQFMQGIMRLNSDGSLDTTFNPVNGVNNRILSVALQPDGKIIVGGWFTQGIMRLNSTSVLAEEYTWACLTPQGNFNSNGSASSYNSYGSATSYNSYGSATSYNSNGSATSSSSNTISFCKSYDPLSFSVGFGQGSDCGTAAGAITTSFPTGGLCRAGTPFLQQILTVASLRDTTFNPGNGTDGEIRSVALQPDGKIIVGGWFVRFDGVTRNHIARLNADGSLDTTFDPGNGTDNFIQSVALQPDGKIIVGGFFTTFDGIARNRIARLNADGSLDTTFDPGNGANSWIYSVALQPDGKIIVGGEFSSFDGTSRNSIARLNADGSLDTTFDPGNGTDSWILSVALQPDGKIIVGGSFTIFNGVARNYIARLNADGSLDTTFDPGNGTDNFIQSVALQPDGKIIVGGSFTSFNGVARNRVARLNADGSLDTTFDPGNGANGGIISIALQPDGKIVMGGQFTKNIMRLNSTSVPAEEYTWACLTPQGNFNSNGSASSYNSYGSASSYNSYGSASSYNSYGSASSHNSYGSATSYNSYGSASSFNSNGSATSFNSNGSATSFNSNGSATSSNSNTISFCRSYNLLSFSVGFQQGFDCGIAAGTIAASFPTGGLCQIGTPYLQQILTVASLADSAIDASFNPGPGANKDIVSIALQPDGKIIIGGNFTTFGGEEQEYIARLNSDGSLDTSFDPGLGANNQITSVVLQRDGNIIVGGQFTTFDGESRNRIARLKSDGSLDASFDPGAGADGDGDINSIVLQSDEKILIGGAFTTFGDESRNRIARLNSDGSLDTSFDPGAGADGTIRSIALRSDEQILIGGAFTTFGGESRNRIARLNSDGSLDDSFNPGLGANSGNSPDGIKSITVLNDEKIIIGGYFSTFNGESRNRIARLNSDGSLDTSFDPGDSNSDSISTVVLQSDGKIIVGGWFSTFAGASRNKIARLGNSIPGEIYTWACMTPNGNFNSNGSASSNNSNFGRCGTAAGGSYDTMPIANLCDMTTNNTSVALYDTTATDGTYDWTCGINHFTYTAVSCSANKNIDGVCGTAQGGLTDTFPTANLCATGTPYLQQVGTGDLIIYTWTCLGMGTGTQSQICTSYKKPKTDTCVPYSTTPSSTGTAPLNISNVLLPGTQVAVMLNYDFENGNFANVDVANQLQGEESVLIGTAGSTDYTNSSTYSLTGIINSNLSLKVTFTNLNTQGSQNGQFIQYRQPSDISARTRTNTLRSRTDRNTMQAQDTIVGSSWYGCSTQGWNVSLAGFIPNELVNNPGSLSSSNQIAWLSTAQQFQSYQNSSGQWVVFIPSIGGHINIDKPEEKFLFWKRLNKGFDVTCEICATTQPATTQTGSCVDLPDHAIPNIATSITQYTGVNGWFPSTEYTYNIVPSTTDCAFVCENNYTRSDGECKPNTTTQSCVGTMPSNTAPNNGTTFNQTRINTGWAPNFVVWSHNENGGECTYKCNSNYTRNSTTQTCIANTQTDTCTGILPNNATITNGNTFIQTRNGIEFSPASVTYIALSGVACGFVCNNNYTRNPSTLACNPNTQTVACNGIQPINTDPTNGNTYTQTRTNTGRAPTVSWTPGGTSSCGYTCQNGYTRNGTICAQNPIPFTYSRYTGDWSACTTITGTVINTGSSCLSMVGQPCTSPNGVDTFGLGGTCQGYVNSTGTAVGVCSLGGNACTSNSNCTTPNRRLNITPSNIQYVPGMSYMVSLAFIETSKNPVNVYTQSGTLLGTCNFKEIMGTPDSQWATKLGNGYLSSANQSFTRVFFGKPNTAVGYNSTVNPWSINPANGIWNGQHCGTYGGCLAQYQGNSFAINLCRSAPGITPAMFQNLLPQGSVIYLYGSGSNWQWHKRISTGGPSMTPAGRFNTYAPAGGPGALSSAGEISTHNAPYTSWNGSITAASSPSGNDNCQGLSQSVNTTGSYVCSELSCKTATQIGNIPMVNNIGTNQTFVQYQISFYNTWGPSTNLCNGGGGSYNANGSATSNNIITQSTATNLSLSQQGQNLNYQWQCGSQTCNYTRSNPW